MRDHFALAVALRASRFPSRGRDPRPWALPRAAWGWPWRVAVAAGDLELGAAALRAMGPMAARTPSAPSDVLGDPLMEL